MSKDKKQNGPKGVTVFPFILTKKEIKNLYKGKWVTICKGAIK